MNQDTILYMSESNPDVKKQAHLKEIRNPKRLKRLQPRCLSATGPMYVQQSFWRVVEYVAQREIHAAKEQGWWDRQLCHLECLSYEFETIRTMKEMILRYNKPKCIIDARIAYNNLPRSVYGQVKSLAIF